MRCFASLALSFLFLGYHYLSAQPFTLKLEPFADAKTKITDIASAGDERLFVVLQRGQVYVLNPDGKFNPEPFITLTDRVGQSGNEQGLLGMAFHPEFTQNGYFYLDYTDKSGNTRVSRFQVKPDSADIGNPDSETLLLTVKQPSSNHNGGQICFGPDGYLYIALGDGGGGGDPNNNGQNRKSMLGKLLRINVDSSENGKNYAVPASNPFVNNPDFAPEIWAWGLRNPWRFSFDRTTGDMWIADVGQGEYEEIDFQPASSKGGENYGWRCYEGNAEFNTSGCSDKSSYVFPIYEYGRDGGCSVTGGYVYRGNLWSELQGWYFFADFCSSKIWATKRGDDGKFQTQYLGKFSGSFSTFGQNSNGELFIAVHGGAILRLTTDSCPSITPQITSKTGGNSFCDGDSLRLTASAQENLFYGYRWFRNGTLIPGATTAIYFAKQSGEYSVELSYPTNCSWSTAAFSVTALPKPSVQIVGAPDEIMFSDNSITLAGVPPGGVFAGTGISGNIFDPKAAGVGIHKVTYTFTSQNGCTNVAEKTIIVKSASGTEETSPFEFSAEIVPNPAEQSAQLRLFLPAAAEISICVIDRTGKEISMQKLHLNDGDSVLPIENIAAGSYHLHIICGKYSQTLPFTIIR